MGLRQRLVQHKESFDTILAVATCRDSLFFADLCWPPFDLETELQRTTEDPGVIFESPSRVVVIAEHSSELRYYAGGWCSHQSQLHLEQDRMTAEGYELGVFPSPLEAMLFAERFLAGGQALQEIETLRVVYHRQDTDQSRCTNSSI
jgi:hypothetical protein